MSKKRLKSNNYSLKMLAVFFLIVTVFAIITIKLTSYPNKQYSVVLSPTPTTLIQAQPRIFPGWQWYVNQTGKFKVQAPLAWNHWQTDTINYEIPRASQPAMNFNVPPAHGTYVPNDLHSATFSINFPASIQDILKINRTSNAEGFKGLEYSDDGTGRYANEYTTINGYKTLITYSIEPNPLPAHSGVGIPGHVTIDAYLDVGSNQVLQVSGQWIGNNNNFKEQFMQFLSTLQILK